MNTDLQEAIKIYSTKTHKDLNSFLLDKSKNDIIAIFNDLLTTYINDKNSSTLREFITVLVSGYNHNEKKIGYNGYRQSSFDSTLEYCEVKPKNITSLDLEDYISGNKKTINRLNAGGNFTDYTPERFEKDLKSNLNMLVSGFVDGKLIYIIEFPFSNEDFKKNLKAQLDNYFKEEKRETNHYLRSASFDFKDFLFCKDGIKINYLLNKKELETYKTYFNSKFFEELAKYAK